MSKKTEFKEISVEELIDAIKKLPPDEFQQKWLRWLSEYDEPGFYNRLPGMNRSAKLAYNHIANPEMLLWLIQAAGIQKIDVELAEFEFKQAPEDVHKRSAAIRKCVPWDVLETTLWKPV